LDTETKEWLYAWMSQFEGLILVISHDRTLLNMMCDGILELTSDKARYFDGNYESYKEQAQLLRDAQQNQYQVYEKRKKKMEAWLARIRQRASVNSDPSLGRLLRNKEKYFEREITNKSVDKPTYEKKLVTNMH
jgi:ATPase subunit of ABC transporter with duplicated ATPase domains